MLSEYEKYNCTYHKYYCLEKKVCVCANHKKKNIDEIPPIHIHFYLRNIPPPYDYVKDKDPWSLVKY